MVITITDQATDQIKEMMKDETDNARLRFGIKGGGCSGLSYSLGFEYEVNEDLDSVEEINWIPVFFSKQDIPIIEGTEIDYKQDTMGGGFSIDKPNAIVACGCGSSSNVKEREGIEGVCQLSFKA